MRSLAQFAVLAAAFAAVAAPATAQSGRPAVRAVPTVCQRDLGSAQCGRLQDRLVAAAAKTPEARAHTAAMVETGRRQLDALIDSIS